MRKRATKTTSSNITYGQVLTPLNEFERSMVFYKRAGIRVCLYQPMSITHHDDDPFELDWGDHDGIRVLNAHLIISLRKSKLRKVYFAIKEAEFLTGGLISDRRDEQKDWNQSGWQVSNQIIVKGSWLLLDSTCKSTPLLLLAMRKG